LGWSRGNTDPGFAGWGFLLIAEPIDQIAEKMRRDDHSRLPFVDDIERREKQRTKANFRLYAQFKFAIRYSIDSGECADSQDRSSYGWSVENVRPTRSAGGQALEPNFVARYASNVSLLDNLGKPMPDYPVLVSADSLTELFTTGTSYLIGVRNSVELMTDAFGKITLGIPARGLTTPTLTVNAEGLDGGATIRPASGVHALLGGTDALPGRPHLLNGAMLEQATVNGQLLVPSWQGHAQG
jgi:hypothetical protein